MLKDMRLKKDSDLFLTLRPFQFFPIFRDFTLYIELELMRRCKRQGDYL